MKKIKLKIKNEIDARWLVNCAMVGIEKSYSEGSIRYTEMKILTDKLLKQINKQGKLDK